ncbi:sugar ABC transporter substrate-binding protein [Neorhizobium sp. P12A]|uniref:polysaccharide biosynthesis/export family protein n=1 Tax=Rhizobium/Agrobacterium group TaxID=227290 RepID=UPI001049AF90|nr:MULTISPECIES: polysaccharide biosynthesis/export family protein [Rhizobium/Agrobacterium group]KAA0691420.1 sugar ABC transporter substrate-binding protein [Neorhizobium sp. P12A]TCR73212.1 exopolysaccharide production protein ExoF [Rhizobium sp. BK376]
MIEILPRGKPARARASVRCASLLLLGLCTMTATARAETPTAYHLGVMDKLRIRVAEWQTADGTIRDWSSISGDYTVGPTGSISLPFIGEMSAGGKTPGEVADAIGLSLQKQFGLRDRPSASVELSQYRPIYLSGDVQNPGEYPYIPNLTVIKALSLGGGLRRADAGQRFARDFISAKGDAAVYMAERGRLLMRRARLQAEMSGKDQIEMPQQLQSLPQAADMLASEAALMQSREKRLKLQTQALEDLKNLLQSEVETLAKKSDTQNHQLDLAKEDRDKVEDLAERGLALSARKLTAEQRAADLEAALLDIDTNSLKAKQDISKANQDEITLRNDWDNQLAQEMQDTDTQLESLQLKLSTSQALMQEAVAQSADASNLGADGKGVNIEYSIVREQDGQTKEIPAQENTEVLPGDLIKASSGLYMR